MVVLFDLGNVIIKPADVRKVYEKLVCKVSYERFKDVWENHANVYLWHLGKISNTDAMKFILDKVGSPNTVKELECAFANLYSTEILNKDTIEIIRSLKKQKIKIGVLSNLRTLDLDYLKKIFDINVFDYHFWSCEINLLKPHREIFQYVINHIGCQPNEIYYFDDHEPHVAAAKQLGINAYVADGGTIEEVFKDKLRFS